MSNERVLADQALLEENWQEAAKFYSLAVSVCKRELKTSGHSDTKTLLQLAASFKGRARSLTEIGKEQGTVKASPEILHQAHGDAQSAVALARHVGNRTELASTLRTLSEVLAAQGKASEAVVALRELETLDPDNRGLRDALSLYRKAEQHPRLGPEARYLGSFRWPNDAIFPPLPPKKRTKCWAKDGQKDSWRVFLENRGGEDLVADALATPLIVDALSFPVSLAWFLVRSGGAQWETPRPEGELHIVILGASDKAEVRILTNSDYWEEFAPMVDDRCTPCLHFVGPEVGQNTGASGDHALHELRPPCAKRFFGNNPHMNPTNTLCVVYNGGFGNFIESGRDDLFWSWLPDLAFLGERGFLCAFFCANDTADLKGEAVTHATLLGSRFVLAPQRNPFGMATVCQGPPSGEDSGEWFCGNCYVYAVCGYDETMRSCANFDDMDMLTKQRLKAHVLRRSRAVKHNELEVFAGTPPTLYPNRIPSQTQGTAQQPASAPEHAHSGPTKDKQLCQQANLPTLGRQTEQQPQVHLSQIAKADGEMWIRMEIVLRDSFATAEVDLDISDERVKLSGPCGLDLHESWPAIVDVERASATFASKRNSLILKAPVKNI